MFTTLLVQPENLQEYLDSGYSKGRKYKHSEETKEKIKNKITGQKRSEEFCKKMSEIAKNQPQHSEESKKAESERMKEYYKTHDNPFLGKKHTDESKEKNRQAKIGKICIYLGTQGKLISPDELNYYLDLGWKVGQSPYRKTHTWVYRGNDEILLPKEILEQYLEEGWSRGRVRSKYKNTIYMLDK